MMIYNECINLDNARYLLSLGEERLVDMFKNQKDKNEHGEREKCDPVTYVSQMTRWLKKAIKLQEKNKVIKNTYKHSKNLINQGRIYVESFGVQRLKKNFRGFLIKDYVNDYDMCNCHPSILNHIIHEYFPDHKHNFKLIDKYVKHRYYFIEENGLKKKEILTAMNDCKKCYSKNPLMISLDNEFKSIQRLIWNEYENRVSVPKVILSKKGSMTKNKYGKYMNIILVKTEHDILNEAMEKFRDLYGDVVHTPMFDGFTMSKEVDEIEALNILNDLTMDMGIRWDTKEHDLSIVKDEGVETDYELEYTYEEQKERFEENHFMIENPTMFVTETTIDGETKFFYQNYDKFRLQCKPVKYLNISANGKKDIIKEFVPKWIEDTHRKQYKEIRFVPAFIEHPQYFNTFRGFNFNVIEDSMLNLERKKEVIETFTKHIGLLTNYHKESEEYVIKYISHLFQKPSEKPMSSMIFKSKQGYGKDLMVDFISKMLGKKYIHRTQKLNDIFGDFNSCLKEKLVVQFSETSGKDGYNFAEEMKDIITADELVIKEKYLEPYTQKNYIRQIILSNNRNPVKIPFDDRRYSVFRSHHRKPKTQYFNKLVDMLNNDDDLQILFNFFSTYDISNFSPAQDRPRTDAYEEMKEHNINPIFEFLHIIFIEEEGKERLDGDKCIYSKKADTYFCTSSEFQRGYGEWLLGQDKGYIIPSFKELKGFLNEMGIKRVPKRILGHKDYYYSFDMETLREQLEPFNFSEEVEDLEDEFDDLVSFGYTYGDNNPRLLKN